MNRWRLVSEQTGGRPNVSSVVIGEDEVDEQLDAEAMMHELAGWTVTRGDRVVVARTIGKHTGRPLVRVISARCSTPFDDELD